MLLKHGSTGRLLVASRLGSTEAFQCQRCIKLNSDSWTICGIKSKTGKSFKEPKGKFVEGQSVRFKGVLYEVVGFNAVGWLPAWDAIVQRHTAEADETEVVGPHDNEGIDDVEDEIDEELEDDDEDDDEGDDEDDDVNELDEQLEAS